MMANKSEMAILVSLDFATTILNKADYTGLVLPAIAARLLAFQLPSDWSSATNREQTGGKRREQLFARLQPSIKTLPSPKSNIIPVQNSTTTSTTTTATTTQTCQVVRRPTLQLDEPSSLETRTCPLIRATKLACTPQKRERPKHLSLYPTNSGDTLVSSPPSAEDVDVQAKSDGQATEGTDPVVPSRPRKRSRISLLHLVKPGPDALLPSPCTGIAHLDLSSPSEEARKRLAMPGPACKPSLAPASIHTPSVTVSSSPPLPQVRIVHTSPSAPPSSVLSTNSSSPPLYRLNKRPISLSVFPPAEEIQKQRTSSGTSTITVTQAWFFNQSSECLDVKSASSLEVGADAPALAASSCSSLPKAPPSPPSELRSSSLEMLPSLLTDTATRSTAHPLDEVSRSSSVSSEGLSVKMIKSASSPMIARRVKLDGVFLAAAAAAAPVMGSLCRSSVLPLSDFPRPTLLTGGESSCRQEESCHLSTSSSLSSVQ
ncbi:unnamed protein product [Schistocephalus solidus]|uniref:Flocculation protein FLO11-like n=1 Tax=Schistocephalus solidus TaxID=70667 RepID=A0A183SPW5_SCHSO|nr:unnamed protein product [Schistocephalus solidus]